MSAIGQDDHTAAPGNGTSDQKPEGAKAPESFDFERGYNELRPEFTRVTQEFSATRERLSEYEQLFESLHDSDPEVQAAAMEALGLELDTGSPGNAKRSEGDEFVDPLEEEIQQLRTVVDELRSARELEASEKESQNLIAMRDEYIGEAVGLIEENLKFKFTEREEEVLGNLAIAMEDEDGLPDVQGAYKALYGEEGVLETNRQRWIDSKTGAAQPPLGTTVPADQRPKTARERAQYMDERLRALDSQQ